MKILLIDNGSAFVEELAQCLSKETFIRHDFTEPLPKDGFDIVILSGGHTSIVGHELQYAREIAFIQNCDKPLLGICLGFELLCSAYGETLQRMNEHIRGVQEVRMIADDWLIHDLETIHAFESHIWVVPSVKTLLPLATSSIGIEIVRHPQKLLYGVQFHPEHEESGTDSKIILERFLEIFEKR